MVQSEGEWKKKYFDNLAELERKEKRWQSVESTLRRCISRLSFVGDGLDPQLDDRLEQLRNRVRGEQDTRALLRLIEDIAGRAEGVVAKPADMASSAPVEGLLSQLLNEAAFSRPLAKRAQKLSQELKRSPVPAESLTAFKTLILEALAQPTASSTNTGLMGKLFAKDKGDNTSGNDSPGQAAGISPPPASGLSEARQLLITLLNRLTKTHAESSALRQLADQVGQAESLQVLDELLVELVGILSEPGEEVCQAPGLLPPVDEVLLQLVERMDISVAQQPRIQALKARLSAGIQAADIPPILTELLQLSEQARIQAEQERRELERFLVQMTEQLQKLDQEVTGIGGVGNDLLAGSRRLDSDMQTQVGHLHATVEQATDLAELKTSIAERLNLIQDRLRGHRSETEQLVQNFEQRIDLLTNRLGDMEQETESLRAHVAQARVEAFTDALTGLNNRHAFDCRLEEEYARWNRYEYPLSMIVVDVDHFKKVNDTYGHLAGDKVLHVIGSHLKRSTRKVDFPARYGGEEFVVLLPEVDLRGARIVAEKIRRAVEEKPFHSGDSRVNITVSCGVASFRKGDGRKTPFERADEALYLAKREGRNRCRTEEHIRPASRG